jgi:WD40 repeat protein
VRFRDAATGKTQGTDLALSASARTVAFSPDGQSLIVGTTANAIEQLGLAPPFPVRRRFISNAPFTRLAIGSQGRLAVGIGPGLGQILNLDSGKPLAGSDRFAALLAQLNGTWSLALSPSESHISVGGGDCRLHVWDTFEGSERFTSQVNRPSVVVTAVAWSRDGRTIASASTDLTIRIWELASGRERRLPLIAPTLCWSLAFSPDGRFIAAGDPNGTLRIWDSTTGNLVATKTGHAGPVTGLAFSADGKSLVSAGVEITVPSV